MKVCIIDDDPICHFIGKKLIEKMVADAQISHFNNGIEAIEFISQKRFKPWFLPELILLDINMPIANAWNFLEMLDEINIKGYQPCIYICSSSEDINDLAKARTFPAVQGYLTKPLNPEVLRNVFQDIAQHRFRLSSKKPYMYCLL